MEGIPKNIEDQGRLTLPCEFGNATKTFALANSGESLPTHHIISIPTFHPYTPHHPLTHHSHLHPSSNQNHTRTTILQPLPLHLHLQGDTESAAWIYGLLNLCSGYSGCQGEVDICFRCSTGDRAKDHRCPIHNTVRNLGGY